MQLLQYQYDYRYSKVLCLTTLAESNPGARTLPVMKTFECYNDHITLLIVSVISQTTGMNDKQISPIQVPWYSYLYKYTSTRIDAVERSPFISVVTFLALPSVFFSYK